jgi:diacylglycerol kinase family enzyme
VKLPHSWHRVDPPERPVLFVNPASGSAGDWRDALVEGARRRGVTVRVLSRGETLAAVAAEAVAGGADALGVAGGDGSLGAVAACALAHGLPFVCVPAGSRNHFALDLGVDRHDPIGTLDAFTKGVERRIDVGRVNGRLFLNNVSLGIYGEAVRRSTYRDAKARTLFETAREVLGPSAAGLELRLVDDEGREHRDPAVVLVSNNPYALERPVAQGTRPKLDSGLLGIIVLDTPGTGAAPARVWSAGAFEVDSPATVHAGIDGEPVALSAPMVFEIAPAALRVRVSVRHLVSPSGLLP